MSWFPLIQKDMRIIARDSRYTIARSILVGVLFAFTVSAFVWIWWQMRQGTLGGLTVRSTFVILAWLQMVVIALGAPAFGVGASADVRDRYRLVVL